MGYGNGSEKVATKTEYVSIKLPKRFIAPFSVPYPSNPITKDLLDAYKDRERVIEECNARLEQLKIYTE